MDLPTQAILFLGIIPALFFLFIALKGYEGYYKDKTIFLTFIIGIVFGIIAAILRYVLNLGNPMALFIPYLVIFAFFEQLLKTIVLNIGRLQGKKETTIYGLSLGLGFGSSFTPFLIIEASAVSGVTSTFLVLVFFGSLGFILFHAGTGAYIGYGVTSGKLIKYLLIAIAIQIPFNLIADLTRFTLDPYTLYYHLGLLVYGLIVFVYVTRKVMPKILKEKKERKTSKN